VSYSDPQPPKWGCLAAILFFVLLGLPMIAAAFLSTCEGTYGTPACEHARMHNFILAGVVLGMVLAITWAGNSAARQTAPGRGMPVWGYVFFGLLALLLGGMVLLHRFGLYR
jgi:hypothetical protein